MDDSKTDRRGLSPSQDAPFLAGGGELGELIRKFNWSNTPLGFPSQWPQSLKTAVRIMLTSRQPIWIGWGQELIYLYNDAYKSIIGGKHPDALGQPTTVVWNEIWNDIGPMLSTAMSGDEGTYVEEQLLIMNRNGYPEETYYTFSYSPIPEDGNDGSQAGGIICANTDDTQRVISERQVATLRRLAADAGSARQIGDVCRQSIRALGTNTRDITFAMLYLVDENHSQATLEGACGIEAGSSVAPTSLALDNSLWPIAEVIHGCEPRVVSDLERKFGGALPMGVWRNRSTQAAVLPILATSETAHVGVLVVGLNPYRQYDDHYQGFLALAASQIAASLASAHAYEEERRRAESLAELDRAKTAFFSNISHEFRTPLTLLLAPVEEILAKPEDQVFQENREQLTLVHRNVLRLQKLVNTLLDFSRIEAGRMQASFEPTDLSSLTNELASNFRSACDRAGLQFTVDCQPLPEPVYVDRDSWEKIVLNLVSNAFKFTLKGEIEIKLKPVADHVELTVRDSGAGIPAEEMPKLFERFHQVEGTLGRTQEGSGIGLALVQELIRLHGGRVSAESELGVGTTFTVTLLFGKSHLPADRINAARTAESTSLGAAPFVAEALRWGRGASEDSTDSVNSTEEDQHVLMFGAGAPARILVADDNADMRDYVTRLLKDEYEVRTVGDGLSAFQMAEEGWPDLILSDVMMPGLDGFELLRKLRADSRTHNLPVLLLSARAGEEARIEGLSAGADDYVVKPFSARELTARVSTHLALAKLRRETAETLRESEVRFRNMADNAPVMIWMTNPDGDCTYLNQQWCEFTATTQEQGFGLGWIDSVHPEDRDAAKVAFVAANENQGPFRIEYRLRRHDGEYRWVIDSAAPRFGVDNEFLGFIGSVIDVTDLKRVESELREADQRKDEFLAMLAHELRNPLAPIRSGLDLLAMEADANANDTIELMQGQVEHLVRLVDDLLDVSRIMRGRIELRREVVDVSALLKRSEEAVRPILTSHGQVLNISMPEHAIWLDVDPIRLVQVIGNLLNNASKYSDAGGVIGLTVKQQGDEAVLTVQDTGIGIEPELLPNVFDLFTQSSRALDRSQGGLGIGLTLVKRLVEMHEGEVLVHSDGLGHGSTFLIRLPVAKQKPSTHHEPASVHASSARRVLAVDDNVGAAWLLSKLLSKLGEHEVETANDGPSALRAVESFRPEVILLDIGLPGMDGYQVAEEIRKKPEFADILLIALTGYGQDDDRRRSQQAGFDEHLVKPPSIEQLSAVLAHPKLTNREPDAFVESPANEQAAASSPTNASPPNTSDGDPISAQRMSSRPNLQQLKHDLINTMYVLELSVQMLDNPQRETTHIEMAIGGMRQEVDTLRRLIETLQNDTSPSRPASD